MAILKMKRMFIAALREDRDSLLNELMKLSCVEFSSPEEGPDAEEMMSFLSCGERINSSLEDDVKKLGNVIDTLERYDKSKRPLFQTLKPMTIEDAINTLEKAESVSKQVYEYVTHLNEINNEDNRLVANIESLKPFETLDVDLGETETAKTRLFVGTIAGDITETDITNSINNAEVELVLYSLENHTNNNTGEKSTKANDVQYVFGLYPKDREEENINVLRSLGFQKTVFRDVIGGSARENINKMQLRRDELQAERKQLENSLTELTSELPDLKAAYDALSFELEKDRKTERLMVSKDTIFSYCWVPEEKVEKVEKVLSGFDCSYEIRDPVEGEEPPIQLKNSKFVEPFSCVTELYSLPSYGGIDPNPFIALFYPIFFGMMLGDAAFGALLAIGCFFIAYKINPKGEFMKKLLKMIGICGISTLIWGILTGSYFGDAIQVVAKTFFGVELGSFTLLINPLEEPMVMLVACLVIGFIHLIVGMAVNAYMLIKRGQVWSAIFDIGFWYLVIFGLVLWALAGEVGKWMTIIGAVGLILTQGREKKNPISKLFSGILSLYDITGYLADILSYSRILALGLSSGIMASVFNTIGTLPGKSIFGVILFIIVFIAGNTFNLAINFLGAFVHSLRLNYVEFFGKFYESGGRAFDPFRRKTKYIEIVDREVI